MRVLRYVILACFLVFVIVTVMLAVARPDMSLRGNQISDLLDGAYSAVARAAFIALAWGAAGLGYLQFRAGRVRFAASVWVYAAATLTAGLTPPNSVSHDVAALTAFLAVPVAIASATFVSRPVRVVLIMVIIATFATWPLGAGLGERLTVYGEIAFMAWVTLSSVGKRLESVMA